MSLADVDRKLAERYGRTGRSGRRTLGWIAVAVVAVAGTGLLGWSTLATAMASVDAETTGYAIVDTHTVEVRFQVSVPPGTGVACALEAQDADHGIVGWRIVELPGSEDHTRSVVERVPTVAEATTGLVRSCWIP